jgi:F-type H+-transporting ATPase subunit gamma
MATLLELRRRVRSVRGIRQITGAMKMVAGAKLRRAQERIVKTRPFSDKVWEVLNDLAGRTEKREHPLLREVPEEEHIIAVIITSDRGLCGSFNANVLRRAMTALKAWEGKDVSLVVVGKLGAKFLSKKKWPILATYPDYLMDFEFAEAAALAQDLIDKFTADETDAVYVIYNEFKSLMQQTVVVDRLLPIVGINFPKDEGITARDAMRAVAEVNTGGTVDQAGFGAIGLGRMASAWAASKEAAEEAEQFEALDLVDFIYDPSVEVIFEQTLPRHVEIQTYRAFLESVAAEHAARRAAMDNATRNADDLIHDLTLTMNKIRQADITTEILEVVGGAEALK